MILIITEDSTKQKIQPKKKIKEVAKMTVIGVNFTKINGERSGPVKGKININSNVSIKNVEKMSISLGKTNQEGLRFTFAFVTAYQPKIGAINLEGEVLFIGDSKQVKDVLTKWQKEKKVEPALLTSLMNNVLNKCNIQALMLSQMLNLPSPIPLPKVNQKQKDKKQDQK